MIFYVDLIFFHIVVSIGEFWIVSGGVEKKSKMT
jgi:hypothetical protein